MVSAAKAQFYCSTEAARDDMCMIVGGYVSIKLYLQKKEGWEADLASG